MLHSCFEELGCTEPLRAIYLWVVCEADVNESLRVLGELPGGRVGKFHIAKFAIFERKLPAVEITAIVIRLAEQILVETTGSTPNVKSFILFPRILSIL